MDKKERNSTVETEWEKACETVRKLEADVGRKVYRAWHGLPLEEKTDDKEGL